MDKLTDSTSFWGIVVVIIILFLILIGFYWFKFILGNSLNYEGKAGEFKIRSSEVSGITFYHTSAFFEGIEYIYSFRNHPEQLENIYLEDDLSLLLNRPNSTKVLYVTRDVDLGELTSGKSVLSTGAFEQILAGDAAIYEINISNTYTTEFGSRQIPTITCEDVNINDAVIYVRLSNESRIYSENECIIIEGAGADGLIRAGEKFAYYLIGVF